MTKLLLIIAVTVVLVYFLKRAGKRGEQEKPPGERQVEDMVRCQVCGVHLPRSEAVMSRGRFYCGEAHRQQDGA